MSNTNHRRGREAFGRQKISTLFKNLTAVAPQLIKDEIALAKSGLQETGKKAGIGVGLFGGAAFFAFFGAIALIIALVFGLATVMSPWAAALVTAIILFVLALIAALIGKSSITKAFKENKSTEAVDGIKYDAKIVAQGSQAELESSSDKAKSQEIEKAKKAKEEKAEKKAQPSPEQLKRRIDASRSYLGDTMDGILYKLDFNARGKEFFEENSAKVKDTFGQVKDDMPERIEGLKKISSDFVYGREQQIGIGVAATAGTLVVSKSLTPKSREKRATKKAEKVELKNDKGNKKSDRKNAKLEKLEARETAKAEKQEQREAARHSKKKAAQEAKAKKVQKQEARETAKAQKQEQREAAKVEKQEAREAAKAEKQEQREAVKVEKQEAREAAKAA
ncbi:MAG: phage holin family protein, partial [Micrococcaceae bacterium]